MFIFKADDRVDKKERQPDFEKSRVIQIFSGPVTVFLKESNIYYFYSSL